MNFLDVENLSLGDPGVSEEDEFVSVAALRAGVEEAVPQRTRERRGPESGGAPRRMYSISFVFSLMHFLFWGARPSGLVEGT